MRCNHFLTITLVFFCVKPCVLEAQVNVKDSVLKFTNIHVHASLSTPADDLKDRFGFFGGVGLSAIRKSRSAWLWGGSASFLFGGNVKETAMVDSITVDDGFLVSTDGTLSDLRFGLRGFTASGGFGKIFTRLGHNVNSGPFLYGSLGYMQHKIHFETDRGTTIPSLEGDYKKGYDRLTGGFLTGISAGYQYFGNNTMVNFFVKFDYNTAFTRNLRSWNFDTGAPDLRRRRDSWFSFSFGWTLPIYRKAATDYFYF